MSNAIVKFFHSVDVVKCDFTPYKTLSGTKEKHMTTNLGCAPGVFNQHKTLGFDTLIHEMLMQMQP
ncbi:hypothetical protein Ahy_B10g106008 isoform C [Arachis hypogaea]|uniref:Uncharacterized protein n=1 Tax=Arachis hypogaea TaxID=3818 RepID=A0A444X9H5_ARAHY|nr:hypothetical protein Ahy_B10g106008 isoform C [Arachis hypogaea]